MNNLAPFPSAVSSVRHPRAGFESIPLFLNYPQRRNTRSEHTERLRSYLGLKGFTESDHATVNEFVRGQVYEGARPHELLGRTEQMLREQYFVLPGITTLERLIVGARVETEEIIFHNLIGRIDVNARGKILAILEVPAGHKSSLFQQLQQTAGRPPPEALGYELALLEIVRSLLPHELDLSDLNSRLVERLATTLSGIQTQTVRRYGEQKRVGILLCWLWRLRTQLIDTALTINNDLIAGVFRRARNAALKEQQNRHKRMGQVIKECGEVVTILLDKTIPDDRVRGAILGHWSEEQLQALSIECLELGAPPDRHLWEICLLEQLRQSLRSGDVHVPHSRTFQPVETHLVSREQWAQKRISLTQEYELPLDFDRHWPKLETLLKESLRTLDEAFPTNPQLEIRDDQFHVARLEKRQRPSTARELKRKYKEC